MVTLPYYWSASFNPNSSYDGGLGLYVDTINFSAGTPVQVGDTFAFSYKISFSGATSFSLTQSVTPVPEPQTLSLLVGGCLAAGLVAFAQNRSAKPKRL